jgi:hypothetical protein
MQVPVDESRGVNGGEENREILWNGMGSGRWKKLAH